MRSPVFWHPRLYEASLRVLYHVHYRERLRLVADEIPSGASVVDVCAGDCALYRYGLRGKRVEYLACDLNETSLAWAGRNRIPTRRLDLFRDAVPPADCVVMMGSLFQFIPREREILAKLIEAARVKVIFNEPVRNLAQSENPLLRGLGRFLSRPDSGEVPHRFTEATLRPLLEEFGFTDIRLTSGGRDLNAVYRVSPSA